MHRPFGRRFALPLLLCLIGVQSASAQNPAEFITFESISVGSTAVGLSVSTYRPSGVGQMATCLGRLEAAEIRYRADGTNPTSLEGQLIEPGDFFPFVSPNEMISTRFIGTGNVGMLKVTCWRAPRALAVAVGALVGPLPVGTNVIGKVGIDRFNSNVTIAPSLPLPPCNAVRQYQCQPKNF